MVRIGFTDTRLIDGEDKDAITLTLDWFPYGKIKPTSPFFGDCRSDGVFSPGVRIYRTFTFAYGN